jgi:outer membrane biogenesis lipoprotein LolB
MSRRLNAGLLLAAAALLGACTDKPQSAATGRHDTPPWQGPAAGQTADAGWKAGDQAAWQEALRTRTQRGQNEYTRAPSQP